MRFNSSHEWVFYMAYTTAPSAVLDQLTAANALTQLNRMVVFPKTGLGDYENVSFQRGETVPIRRAKLITAQDYDPRSGTDMTLTDPSYVSGNLTLEKLFTAAYPIYGHDPRVSADKYIPETGKQIGEAIKKQVDDYFYNKFRTYSIASSGAVAYGIGAPLAIVCAQSSGALAEFNKSLLVNASTVLVGADVPMENTYAVLSTRAGGSFLGDTVLTEGFTAAYEGSGGRLLSGGMNPGQFVDRYGFMTTRSNAVTGQTGVADLDTAASTQATLAIASVAQDTSVFTRADEATTTYLGAVNITLTAGTALSNSVVVGQIARIGPSNNITAMGVILRIDRTTATAPVVTLVPYSPSGQILTAAQITAGTDLFSVPTIGSVSVAYHKEALLFATRPLRAPSDGSGAVLTTQADADLGMSLGLLRGSYNVLRLRESNVATCLTGAVISDYRKAVLMVSL